jgi:AraC family transcriptional regulator
MSPRQVGETRHAKGPGYAKVLGDRFSLKAAPEIITDRTDASISMVRGNASSDVVTVPIPYDDAFVLLVRLEGGVPYQLWIDGKFTPSGRLASGSTSIFDLRTNPYALGIQSSHHVHFYFSKACLEAAMDDARDATLPEIVLPRTFAFHDPVMLNIATALSPAFQQHAYTSSLFVDHLATASASHFISTYGTRAEKSPRTISRMSSEQLARAKEMLDAKIDGNVTVRQLAGASGLRPDDFKQAFKLQTGVSPPEWLVRRRTGKAIDLPPLTRCRERSEPPLRLRQQRRNSRR